MAEQSLYLLRHTGRPNIIPLSKRYPAIHRRHFIDIFNGTFLPENLTKLSNDYCDGNTHDPDLPPVKPRDLPHLCLCLESFCMIILEFAQPSVIKELQQALSQYRARLYNLVVRGYTFDSILTFNNAFLNIRLCERLNGFEDDPAAWRTIDITLENVLLQHPSQEENYAAEEEEEIYGKRLAPNNFIPRRIVSKSLPGGRRSLHKRRANRQRGRLLNSPYSPYNHRQSRV